MKEIEARFRAKDAERSSLLELQREAAALTLPSVVRPKDWTLGMEAESRRYQNIGSRGVTTLTAKMAGALFPPALPWFASVLDPYFASGDVEAREVAEAVLYSRDQVILEAMEAGNYRTAIMEILRHLCIPGNALWRVQPNGNIRVYPTATWVCTRQSDGTVTEIVYTEKTDWLSLKPEWQARTGLNISKGAPPEDRMVDTYTQLIREPGQRWRQTQECNGNVYFEREWDILPWAVTRYGPESGSDYASSLVMDNIEDLRSYDSLSGSGLEAGAAAAKLLFAVDPSCPTSPARLSQMRSGEFFAGQREHISAVGIDKLADFQITQAVYRAVEERLGRAFVLDSVAQPTGERVTATQVSRVANELDSSLGGAFTFISDELQLPLVRIFEDLLVRRKIIEKVHPDAKAPKILTGLEALRRERESQGLIQAVQAIGSLTQGEGLRGVRMDVLAERIFRGFGVDTDGLLKTPEELAAEQQAALEQQVAQQSAEKTIDVVGDAAEEQMTNG